MGSRSWVLGRRRDFGGGGISEKLAREIIVEGECWLGKQRTERESKFVQTHSQMVEIWLNSHLAR